jgi:hypothetical protein
MGWWLRVSEFCFFFFFFFLLQDNIPFGLLKVSEARLELVASRWFVAWRAGRQQHGGPAGFRVGSGLVCQWAGGLAAVAWGGSLPVLSVYRGMENPSMG